MSDEITAAQAAAVLSAAMRTYRSIAQRFEALAAIQKLLSA